MFSPEQFLDMQITESNDTKTIPVPVGEYTAVAEEVKCRPWQSKKDPSMSGLTLDIKWSIDDPAVKELLGRDKVTVNQGIMLDLTDSGGLDMGKGRNIGLGRLREALGLNAPGQPFSFMMISGRVAKVNVSHRIDGENIYAEVKGVAKLG
jgi:hypothetical protein